MSELVLLLLRLAFLVLLWGFVFFVVMAVRRDMTGRRVPRDARRTRAASSAQALRYDEGQRAVNLGAGLEERANRLIVTHGPEAGKEVRFTGDIVTIGRAAESDLPIVDDYTSTHHARLLLWNGSWMIQDLDSTNGTFVDGQRVTVPVPLPLNTPVTIGHTTFELRS